MDGTRQALPIETNTSGDFTSLSGTHGYVELRGDQEEFKAKTLFFKIGSSHNFDIMPCNM